MLKKAFLVIFLLASGQGLFAPNYNSNLSIYNKIDECWITSKIDNLATFWESFFNASDVDIMIVSNGLRSLIEQALDDLQETHNISVDEAQAFVDDVLDPMGNFAVNAENIWLHQNAYARPLCEQAKFFFATYRRIEESAPEQSSILKDLLFKMRKTVNNQNFANIFADLLADIVASSLKLSSESKDLALSKLANTLQIFFSLINAMQTFNNSEAFATKLTSFSKDFIEELSCFFTEKSYRTSAVKPLNLHGYRMLKANLSEEFKSVLKEDVAGLLLRSQQIESLLEKPNPRETIELKKELTEIASALQSNRVEETFSRNFETILKKMTTVVCRYSKELNPEAEAFVPSCRQGLFIPENKSFTVPGTFSLAQIEQPFQVSEPAGGQDRTAIKNLLNQLKQR